jgi:hypothetical protein
MLLTRDVHNDMYSGILITQHTRFVNVCMRALIGFACARCVGTCVSYMLAKSYTPVHLPQGCALGGVLTSSARHHAIILGIPAVAL